jgi:O-antigen/teichoic acid export membrane protein
LLICERMLHRIRPCRATLRGAGADHQGASARGQPPEAILISRVRALAQRELRRLLNDALYRGSAVLLLNTVIASALGFVFWTLAAHEYSAATVGVFSSVIAGTGLLAAIAALGWQNTMIRHIAGAENSRELVVVAMAVIATVGSALCLLTVLTLGPHLPAALGLRQHGRMVAGVTVLVAFTAVSGISGAGLVAMRSTLAILITDTIGSIVQITALIMLATLHSWGLLLAFGLGLVLATAAATVVLLKITGGKRPGLGSFLVLRKYLSTISGNYLATVLGVLPSSVVPLEVLLIRGPAEAARFAIAAKVAGFLDVVPSTVALVFFAEASRRKAPFGEQLSKALRGVYGLLLPAVAVAVVAAPYVLDLFGGSYSAAATGCLRVLALSALLTGGTYLVDSVLIASDRIAAYVFINGANAALVLTCMGVLLPHGLTAAAAGWAIAQGASLAIGLILIATGRAGRHRLAVSRG